MCFLYHLFVRIKLNVWSFYLYNKYCKLLNSLTCNWNLIPDRIFVNSSNGNVQQTIKIYVYPNTITFSIQFQVIFNLHFDFPPAILKIIKSKLVNYSWNNWSSKKNIYLTVGWYRIRLKLIRILTHNIRISVLAFVFIQIVW